MTNFYSIYFPFQRSNSSIRPFCLLGSFHPWCFQGMVNWAYISWNQEFVQLFPRHYSFFLGERWFIEITFLYRTWYCGKRGFIFLFIFQLIPLSLNHKKLKRREKRENLSEGEKYSKGKGREGLQIDLNLWQFIEQRSTTETNHSFQCPHGYLSFWVIFRKSID